MGCVVAVDDHWPHPSHPKSAVAEGVVYVAFVVELVALYSVVLMVYSFVYSVVLVVYSFVWCVVVEVVSVAEEECQNSEPASCSAEWYSAQLPP